MITDVLASLAAKRHLSRAEAANLVDLLLSDEISDAQAGAILMGMSMKGETAEELAGIAEAMRDRCPLVRTHHKIFIDTAGTGGDGVGTFNISTATAIVTAASGLPVAKHGNRAASSRSGSADVLRALGVEIEMPTDVAGRLLDEIGVCFLYAPFYHDATRRVAEVRRQLQIRTAFNYVGPLTNPARAPRQLIGVGSNDAVERVAKAAAMLGIERAWVVHGDGLDEITVTGWTHVAAVRDGELQEVFEIDPSAVGLPIRGHDSLRGGSPEENAAIIEQIISGDLENSAAREIVVLNTAAALVIGDVATSLSEGIEIATVTLDSGRAIDTLEQLRHWPELIASPAGEDATGAS